MQKGASLVQYAVIIALVSIGVIFAYSLFGQQIVKQLNLYNKFFEANSNSVKNNAKIISQNNGSGLMIPGQWNGGAGNPPVSKCINGVCDVDFGNYILSGIPEDFKDFTKANGASGANEKIYSLYMQLAKQLEANGDAAGAQELKDLANIVKFTGEVQKQVETLAKSCKSQYPDDFIKGVSYCFNPTLVDITNYRLSTPDELKSILLQMDDGFSGSPDASSNTTLNGSSILSLFSTSLIGNTRGTNGDVESQRYPAGSLDDAFAKKYDDIVANPKYSENLKGIIKELYLDVADVNMAVISNVTTAYSGILDQNKNLLTFDQIIIDPLTGNRSTTKHYEVKSFDDIIDLTLDDNQNIVSALQCASQNYQNAQSQCHNK